MFKIHPSTVSTKSEGLTGLTRASDSSPSVWTVWKKSSMTFQGTDGFSVYDDKGRLAFRVDNYSRKHKELLLMDGEGRALLALRPRVLSIHDQWNGFRSDDGLQKISSKSQIFSMRRRRSFVNSSNGLEIFMTGGGGASSSSTASPEFRIEGSFWRRSCKILSRSGGLVAQISRKVVPSKSVVLSDDVFSLVVHPGVDCDMVMAFVVIMDRICPKPRHAPVMCSLI